VRLGPGQLGEVPEARGLHRRDRSGFARRSADCAGAPTIVYRRAVYRDRPSPDGLCLSPSPCETEMALALSVPSVPAICTPRRSSDMKRRVPRLASDEEAEAFLEADLSDLDFSQFKSGRLRFEDQSGEGRPSETYLLFELAMVEGKRVVCMYNGQLREVCPVILGHKDGEERALTYQLSGASTSTELPPGGDW